METGPTASHYRIIRPRGRSGLGHIYLADDTKVDRQVAINVNLRFCVGRFILEGRHDFQPQLHQEKQNG
jgi:hypothetical protein